MNAMYPDPESITKNVYLNISLFLYNAQNVTSLFLFHKGCVLFNMTACDNFALTFLIIKDSRSLCDLFVILYIYIYIKSFFSLKLCCSNMPMAWTWHNYCNRVPLVAVTARLGRLCARNDWCIVYFFLAPCLSTSLSFSLSLFFSFFSAFRRLKT